MYAIRSYAPGSHLGRRLDLDRGRHGTGGRGGRERPEAEVAEVAVEALAQSYNFV